VLTHGLTAQIWAVGLSLIDVKLGFRLVGTPLRGLLQLIKQEIVVSISLMIQTAKDTWF